MRCGGYGQDKAADEEVHELLVAAKAELAAALSIGENEELQIISYTTQVVAGKNYKLVLQLGERSGTCTIFKPLPHTKQPPSVSHAAWDM
eukprot:CAMPEP_0183331054 /NCGR_PEP_ID=MMETSP0164_2-20130417/458_1 /TAXON_ID=221442 /ORGANISM="Coccolithus pelagicus ssp braarudi, Strain PLY182g" /LENGTH=89 /DNA_ID=CAMNT_0025499415 /DNA_START=49 /DNA_END=318 /DNA_ORIENTATION=-